MKTKRITSLLLCIAMLLSLAACAGDEAEEKETTAAQTDAVETEIETEPNPYDPGLPDRDFGGIDFIIAVRGNETEYEWDVKDVEVDNITGDPVNDAIYDRTVFLEEKYNVDIDALCCGDVGESGTWKIVSDAVMTNDTSFQAILNSLGETSEFALEDFLVDLKKVENLNLSQPWWDQNANKELQLAGNLYFTASEMTTVDNDAVLVLLFDKSIVEQYNLDNPYEDVLNGTWTMDKMMSNSAAVTTDLDGNGKMNEDDRFGFLYWQDAYMPLLHGMGNTIGELGEDGLPVLTFYNEHMFDSWAKLNAYITSGTTLARKNELDIFKSDQGQSIDYMLAKNNVLYIYACVVDIIILRENDTDFGVLPYPKFDEAQQRYFSTISGWGASVLSIPITNTNLADTGFLLEAYCAKSAELLTPAYYDVQLTRKGIRDEDSAAMLDIIFSTVKYDIGDIFDWGSVCSILVNNFNSKKAEIASPLSKYTTKAETALQETLDKLLAED